MSRLIRVILAILFITAIAVSAISLSHGLLKNTRLDLTEQKLYTLSDGTKQILASLKQPITMKLFYARTAARNVGNDQIRYYNNYYTFVKALLEQYEKEAAGKLSLEIIDPRPYTQEEMAAMRYGLKRFQLDEEETFMFGLVVQTQFGATKTIDFFAPNRQQLVEYDISYLIDTAVAREKKRLGVLSSLDVIGDTGYMAQMKQMQGQQPNHKWGLIRQLEQQYDVVTLPVDTDTIENVDFLMVILPKDLSERTVFAIDQFVLNGGRAIIAVDPHCVADPPEMNQRFSGGRHDSASNLETLLETWGLTMPEQTFAGDRRLAVTGAVQAGQRPQRLLSIMKLESAYDCFNTEKPMTAQLREVTMVFPGVLKRHTDSESPQAGGVTYTPLLFTSETGNTWTVRSEYELMDPDYGELLRRFRDGDKPVTMAYLLSGHFRTAFPEGIAVPVETAEQNASEDENTAPQTEAITGLTESAAPGAVVVLADVDMLSDLVAYQRTFFGVSPVGDNGTFVLNALEELSGSANLVSIRSRGNYNRPFLLVEEIEAKAETETADEEARIMATIQEFERQLNEKLRAVEGEDKGALISQTIIEEKKKIELALHEAEKQLRDIKMQKRQHVETLKIKLWMFCTLLAPALILMIAIVLGVYRSIKRRRYISHASDA